MVCSVTHTHTCPGVLLLESWDWTAALTLPPASGGSRRSSSAHWEDWQRRTCWSHMKWSQSVSLTPRNPPSNRVWWPKNYVSAVTWGRVEYGPSQSHDWCLLFIYRCRNREKIKIHLLWLCLSVWLSTLSRRGKSPERLFTGDLTLHWHQTHRTAAGINFI